VAKKVQLLPIHEFRNERTLLSTLKGAKGIIALDEVGRGCLAGPVATCASLWVDPSSLADASLSPLDPHGVQRLWIPLIRDSKKLTPRAREICFDAAAQSFEELRKETPTSLIDLGGLEALKWSELVGSSEVSIAFDTKGALEARVSALASASGKSEGGASNLTSGESAWRASLVCVGVALGAASAGEIDEINIWNAVQLSMGRSLRILARKLSSPWVSTLQKSIILVDGNHSVRVPREFSSNRQVTAVGGDDAFACVGLSSIVAKVLRDRFMLELGLKYPEYGIEKHKGYATSEHKQAIVKFGPAVIHRRSFLGKTLHPDGE
jgi:ribonuclease HII